MGAVSVRWSIYTGLYAFVIGTALSVPLRPVTVALFTVLSLSPGLTRVLVPGSGAGIAAVVWWTVVEWMNWYTYPVAGAVGLLTAVFTVLFWTLLVTIVWGLTAIQAAGAVIGFVLVIVAPIASLAWLPLMYVRLRRGRDQTESTS